MVSVWQKGITGNNVVVCILDDGIEGTHPDLAKNYVSLIPVRRMSSLCYGRHRYILPFICQLSRFESNAWANVSEKINIISVSK